ELGTAEVADELAAIGVAARRPQPVERAHEGCRQRHREPDDAVAGRRARRPRLPPAFHRGITIRQMITRARCRHIAAVLAGLLSVSTLGWAQEREAPSPLPRLPPITVPAPPPVSSSSEQIIPGRDFELRPQGRPADVLRLVPGLIIDQHQGGGKAEQYLIRGFDADHGTDLALFVDGLPVNLRSHAHGQGYADLHFLIPETIKAVDVFKGPYFPEFGDFDTAAAVVFLTRDGVEENTLEVAGGSFNTQRYLALVSPTRDALKTFIAFEGYRNDGP